MLAMIELVTTIAELDHRPLFGILVKGYMPGNLRLKGLEQNLNKATITALYFNLSISTAVKIALVRARNPIFHGCSSATLLVKPAPATVMHTTLMRCSNGLSAIRLSSLRKN